jgi:hypothetical protein
MPFRVHRRITLLELARVTAARQVSVTSGFDRYGDGLV